MIGNGIDGSIFKYLGNYNFLIATIFLLLAILAALYIKRAKLNAENYKKRQLEVYNKNRPNQRPALDYKKTNLYLPFFEKAKLSTPIMLTVLFSILAITFLIGGIS